MCESNFATQFCKVAVDYLKSSESTSSESCEDSDKSDLREEVSRILAFKANNAELMASVAMTETHIGSCKTPNYWWIGTSFHMALQDWKNGENRRGFFFKMGPSLFSPMEFSL